MGKANAVFRNCANFMEFSFLHIHSMEYKIPKMQNFFAYFNISRNFAKLRGIPGKFVIFFAEFQISNPKAVTM